MMNSSYSSDSAARSSIAPQLCVVCSGAWLVLLAALLLGGCGSDEETKSCDDDDAPSIPTVSKDVLVIGQLRFESRTSFDIDGKEDETVKNIVSAVFVDNSRVERISRSTDDQKFSPTCAGLTGAPTDKCREPYTDNCTQVKLEVEKVDVSGVADGLNLEEKGPGTFVDGEAPDPLYGTDDVEVSVTGKTEEGFFPSFDLSVTPPKDLNVEKPVFSDLVGSRDLEICWNGGDGDMIEIQVAIERSDPSKKDTDKVVCLVKDDGCHIVPVGAFDWLRLGDMVPADQFKLTLVRHKIALKEIDKKTAAEVKAAHRVEMLLSQDE